MKTIISILLIVCTNVSLSQLGINYTSARKTNGASLSCSFPAGKNSQRTFITAYVCGLISSHQRHVSDNGENWLEYGNMFNAPFSATVEYRIPIGEKIKIIPAIGIFGEIIKFDHQPEKTSSSPIVRASRGEGGIVMPISIRYSLKENLSLQIGYNLVLKDNGAYSYYSRSRHLRIGIIF